MSQKYCCVPGCVESGDSHPLLHKFPNPNKFPDRFRSWVMAVGGDILGLDNQFIYANRKVCHRHFLDEHCCRFNKLSQLAVPRKKLPGLRSIPQFTFSDRPLRALHNIVPSTSKDEYGLFGPEYSVRHHSLQESSATTTEKIDNKENIESIEAVHCNIKTIEIQPSTQIPSTAAECSVKETDMTECPNKRSYSEVSQSAGKNEILINSLKTKRRRIGISMQEKMLYTKIRSLKVKLNRWQNTAKQNTTAIKMAKNVMTNPSFVNSLEKMTNAGKMLTLLQFRECKKKSRGRRFTLKEKITSLFIFKRSPKAYRLLRKIFVLPAPHTLHKLVRKAMITPGINEKIFDQLKKRAENMKEEHKLCVLLFDEVALQTAINYNETQDKLEGLINEENVIKFANHATVFMLRGLVKNFKQPIAYTFCSGATKASELKKYIVEIIKKVQDAGFHIIATVCDQGANNQKAIKNLVEDKRINKLRDGEELKSNTFDVNGSEIIPLYDPPHLLKGIRNNLIINNLKYKNDNGEICTAKWEHLRMLYAENPAYKGIRLIPKLTEQHVVPEKIGKMRVKFASQIFSQTVSSNMGYLADKGILPTKCKDTADLLLFFDKLFDSMNGSYGKKTKFGKPFLTALTPNSVHHKLWEESKKKLKTMEYISEDGKKKNVPTLNNFLWTIEDLENLIKKISQNYETNSIWTRHLNQDPLENFFGSIRSHGGRNVNPSPSAFQSAFTALTINHLKSIHVAGSNCEEDFCESLQVYILSSGVTTNQHVLELNIEHINISPTPISEKKTDVKAMASLTYVSGFILKNCKKRVFKNCKICNNVLMNKNKDIEYLKYREYSGRGWCVTPMKILFT